jgi:hypothetical protein
MCQNVPTLFGDESASFWEYFDFESTDSGLTLSHSASQVLRESHSTALHLSSLFAKGGQSSYRFYPVILTLTALSVSSLHLHLLLFSRNLLGNCIKAEKRGPKKLNYSVHQGKCDVTMDSQGQAGCCGAHL